MLLFLYTYICHVLWLVCSLLKARRGAGPLLEAVQHLGDSAQIHWLTATSLFLSQHLLIYPVTVVSIPICIGGHTQIRLSLPLFINLFPFNGGTKGLRCAPSAGQQAIIESHNRVEHINQAHIYLDCGEMADCCEQQVHIDHKYLNDMKTKSTFPIKIIWIR